MAITIRLALPADAPDMAEIHMRSWEAAYKDILPMAFAFDKARGLGKTAMTVWVFAENTNSIRFYEKCGFTPDGNTKILDCGKTMECIRMRKSL